ncbi:MAG: hypothetical protein ACREPX_01625 [Rhodanobacteraceae bacterium]
MDENSTTRKPPFDGGPAFPCEFGADRCGMSVRTNLFTETVARGAFVLGPTGDFLPAHAIIDRALEITDAGMDALEVQP